MWQFIQDYWTWFVLGLVYIFMMKMHMGGGHSMHGSSNPQGAATQAGGGHQHDAQPTPPATGQENQSMGNMSNMSNTSNTSNADNSTSSDASAGQTRQSPSGHGGCH